MPLNSTRQYVLLLAVALNTAASIADEPPARLPDLPIGAGKTLLDGCTRPQLSELAQSTDKFEKEPFGGLLLQVTKSFADEVFAARPLTEDVERSALAHLNSIDFRRYKDNFIWVSLPPRTSHSEATCLWYDDARWLSILHNVQLAARIAKRGGLKGLFLDTEHRRTRLFSYRAPVRQLGVSYRVYCDQVRRRGHQVAMALRGSYSDITLILTMGTSAAAFELNYEPDLPRAELSYSLLPAFVDGLLEAAPRKMRIVDGYRRAFHFTEYDEYVAAYNAIKRTSGQLSVSPKLYRDRISVAFGVNLPWHPDLILEDTVHYALSTSERYVWLWSHHRDRKDPLSKLDRTRVFSILNSRLARSTAKPTPTSDLREYWGLKSPHFYALKLKQQGFREVEVQQFGSASDDEEPQSGVASFVPGASRSVSFDYRRTSMVLDLGTIQRIDAIQMYGGTFRPGNVRLDQTNVSLYVSNDNTTYRRIECTYREPGPHAIELGGIQDPARYFKIANTIQDSSHKFGFTAGTDFGGARAFVKTTR